MEEIQSINNSEVFTQLRVEFTNYHQQKKALDTFNFFSGNENNIKELAERVLKVLLEHMLVVKLPPSADGEDGKIVAKDLDQLRGTLMYLVLNSKNNDGHDEAALGDYNLQIVHLLKHFPVPLPQLLTVSLALKCGLEQPLLDFLACGPYWLTSKYFDCLNEVLSHVVVNRSAALSMVCKALSAVTKSICYYAAPIAKGIESNPFESLVPNAKRMLQRYLLDTEDRLCLIPIVEHRHRYLGEAMQQLLDVLMEAVRALKLRPTIPEYFMIFAVRSPSGTAGKYPQEAEVNDKLRDYVGKLLDAVQRLVPLISVNTYMTWNELPSGKLFCTLQGHINDQSQELKELLSGDETLKKHSIYSHLTFMAEGAKTFDKRLEELKMGELLSFLEDNKDSTSCDKELRAVLDQLMNRPIAFGSDECVDMMVLHVKLLEPSHGKLIMYHLDEIMKLEENGHEADYSEYNRLLKDVLQPIFLACPNAQQKLELLTIRDELQLLNKYRFYQSDFESRLTFFFNEVSYKIDDYPMLKFLDLCYENPGEVWRALAQQGMTSPQYELLYWQIGEQCGPHALYHVNYTVSKLLEDRRVLTEPLYQTPPERDIILKLYAKPIIWNGLHYKYCPENMGGEQVRKLMVNLDVEDVPYKLLELEHAQDKYLAACVAGIEKFLGVEDYVALTRILKLLFKLEEADDRILEVSYACRNIELQRVSALKEAEGTLEEEPKDEKCDLAEKYVVYHKCFSSYRKCNWTLISQIIFTLDNLRDEIQYFEIKRIDVLDLVVEYYRNKILPMALSDDFPDLPPKILEDIKGLHYPHLWSGVHMKGLAVRESELQEKECIKLLRHASTEEVWHLMKCAIRNEMDVNVMVELDAIVDALKTEQAVQFYNFVYKIYMKAFKKYLIEPAGPADYPNLTEQLVQAPKLFFPENRIYLVENAKILLQKEGDQEMIIELLKPYCVEDDLLGLN